MDTQDLAFYLATHGFDVTPKNGYVEANLGGRIYKLTPQWPGTGALQRSGLMPSGDTNPPDSTEKPLHSGAFLLSLKGRSVIIDHLLYAKV